MKLSSQKLIAALNTLKQVATGNHNVIQCDVECGLATLRASNSFESMELTFEAKGEDSLSANISINQILGTLWNSDETVELKLDGSFLIFKPRADSTCRIPVMPENIMQPMLSSDGMVKQGVDCLGLSVAMATVSFCASNDKERPILNSVHVTASEKLLSVESTNGRDGAFLDYPLICAGFEILVPKECQKNLSDFLAEDGAVFSSNARMVSVECGSGKYTCKQIDGKFPSTKFIKDMVKKPVGDISADDFLVRLKTAHVMNPATQTEMPVLASFTNDSLDLDTDSYTGKIAGAFKEFQLKINGMAIQKCLGAFKGQTVKISTDDDRNKIIMQSGNLTVVSMGLLK